MGIDLDKLKRDYTKSLSGSKSDTFSPPDGETRIRILPPWDSLTNLPYKTIGYHDLDGERYLCPKEISGQPCPMCERSRRLYMTKNEENAALAREIRAIQRYVFNIVVRGQENMGVQKFACGSKLKDKIMSIMLNELSRDITDPADGNDIMVVKKKIGDFPDYSSSYAVYQPSPLGNNELLGMLYNLDNEYVTKSYDELRLAMEKKLGPVQAASNSGVNASTYVPPVQQPIPVQASQPQMAPPQLQPPQPVAQQPQPQQVVEAPQVQQGYTAPQQPATPQPTPAQTRTTQQVSAEDILTMIHGKK